MTPQPIDLDAEAIQFEGHWYTRDELARKIKSMLDAGDFATVTELTAQAVRAAASVPRGEQP